MLRFVGRDQFSGTSQPWVPALLLVLFTICGLWSADGANPKPCTQPWQWLKDPTIGGLARGTGTICPNNSADITVHDDNTPGGKYRCDLTAEVGTTETKWEWTVTGPEGDSGEGNYIGRTWSKPGTYRAVFTGSARSLDPICNDPADATAEFEFTVTGPSFTVTLSIDPSHVCPGESATAVGTISDTSTCDFPPYVVKWRLENTGGNVQLTMAPDNGSQTLAHGETKEVQITITKSATASGGISSFTFTGKTDFAEETATDDLMTVKLLSVTHTAIDYQPWTQGLKIPASAEIEGELGDKEILYEIIDVNSGVAGGSISVASTAALVPVEEPGRYRIQATLCNQLATYGKPFVCWVKVIAPKAHTIKWDSLTDILNPDEWSLLEQEKKVYEEAVQLAADFTEKLVKERIPESQAEIQKAIDFYVGVSNEKNSEVERIRAQRRAQLEEIDRLLAAQWEQGRIAENLLAQRGPLQQQLAGLSQELREWEFIYNNPLSTPEAKAAAASRIAAVSESIAGTQRQIAQLEAGAEAARQAERALRSQVTQARRVLAKIQESFIEASRVAEKARDIVTAFKNVPTDKNYGKVAQHFLGVCRNAARILGPLGIAFDLQGAVTAYDEYEEAVKETDQKLKTAQDYAKRHEAAFNAWMNSPVKRLPSPQEIELSITSRPGALPIKLMEFPSFTTRDEDIPNSEAPFNHFTFLNNNPNAWESPASEMFTSSGQTGQCSFKVFARGNLGSGKILALVSNVAGPNSQSTITSQGKTKEKLREMLDTQVAQARADGERLRAKIQLISSLLAGAAAVFTVALVVVSAIFGVAFAPILLTIAGIAGIIAGLVSVITALWGWLWPERYPIQDSIVDLFPSGKLS